MSTTVFLYRFFCQTENAYVTIWSTSSPTVCPNNNTHTILTNTISILDIVSQNNVFVKPEIGTTGGEYRAEAYTLSIGANATQTTDLSWPFDISVSTVSFNTTTQNTGDILNSFVAPNTTIGSITSAVSIGDTTINVNSSVFTYLKKGFLVTLADQTNTSTLGQVIDINSTTGTISCELPSTFAFNAGSYLQFTENNIRNFMIGPPGNTSLTAKGSTASSIPAKTIVRVQYKNNSAEAKLFNFYFEYFY